MGSLPWGMLYSRIGEKIGKKDISKIVRGVKSKGKQFGKNGA